jgi:hypothetical protein
LWPSASEKRKRGKRGPTRKLKGRYIIIEVAHDGEPMTPTNAARNYIREYGRLMRDHIPISFRLWKSNNANEQIVAVPQRDKEQLWHELKNNFTLPPESEELVKD